MSDVAVKYRTYAVTFRPRNGILPSQISTLAAWIKKRCEFYHVVTEKTGSECHLHAACYLKTEVTRSNFYLTWMRELKKFNIDQEETEVARKGVRIMYNDDFVDNYLNKDDDTVVIESCMPERSSLIQYYPPKPDDLDKSRAKKCSIYYHELEALWNKHKRPLLEVNTQNCRDFLFNMMYSQRCIPVIRDDKMIVQTARHLCRWLNKTEYSTIELAPFETEE